MDWKFIPTICTGTSIRLAITATSGGLEEASRLIATSGDQLDLRAIADKFAAPQIDPPLLGGPKD